MICVCQLEHHTAHRLAPRVLAVFENGPAPDVGLGPILRVRPPPPLLPQPKHGQVDSQLMFYSALCFYVGLRLWRWASTRRGEPTPKQVWAWALVLGNVCGAAVR